VLSLLNERRLPTVVYVDGLDGATRRKLESETLRFERERVDLRRAAAECDLAVLHAGQGATAAVLLAGKPVLQLPLVLEQRLTADAVVRLGAGERATPGDPESLNEKLNALLASDRYAEAARRFAAKYADFDPAAQVERMAGRVEELLGGAASRPPRRAVPTPRVTAGVFAE
jgi:UDP:flavonoid glycosyltransferase YjiC (YdhE family)